ncbi:MAG: sugar phosphate isomerase/epimerase [Candidatus Hydrogenedentes bacterium]|nr:sugar phosphate isomerase/epimerase [Candidatus Hydrogenedentota bacterium]
MKLGMVTYNMGKDMKLPDLIAFCTETGLEGVELRTTHAHGVEIELSKAERADVKKRFDDSPVEIAGLGSAYEYHSMDPAVVKENIEGSKAYAQLAADVGAPGIKVRPNGLNTEQGVPVEQTCEQIGLALREVAAFAEGLGVQVRLEVHGRESQKPAYCRMMMDCADHPNALICWNSNPGEVDERGSIDANFELLKHKIALVHITDIGIYQYPWQDLFNKLDGIGYQGYCLAEVQYNEQPERFMKYYRTLFDLYTGNYRWPRT